MEPVEFVRDVSPNETVTETFYVVRLLPRSGKQGIVGIVSRRREPRSDADFCIFKISQYLNYTCRQEDTIMQDLHQIQKHCPHFCKSYGVYRARVNPNFREADNPFNLKHVKVPIEVDVLMMEFIPDAHKWARYISNRRVEDEVNFSVLKRVMISMSMAQRACRLAHYDLHSNNVLITRTDPGAVNLYLMEDGRTYLVPTYGFDITIIDFGFGYSQALDGKPIYGALAHTQVGFMSSCFEDSGDSKLLLATVSWEMDEFRGKRVHRKFRTDCTRLLKELEVDMESGWDVNEDMAASDYVIALIEQESKDSRFFDECGMFAMDIVQYLITLPLKPRRVPELYQAFQLVKAEFIKLEQEIGSNFFLLYIFKKAVEAVAALKDQYMDGEEKHAISAFRHLVYQAVDSVAKYARARLDYEKLFVGLLGMARSTEGLLYKVVESRMREKEEKKRRMEIRELPDMLHYLYYKYQDDYDLDSNTTIHVYDEQRGTSYMLSLSEDERDAYNAIEHLTDRNDWLRRRARVVKK